MIVVFEEIWPNIRTVSYTHLDVYKRQVLGRHDLRHLLVEVGLEAQVAVGDDTDEVALVGLQRDGKVLSRGGHFCRRVAKVAHGEDALSLIHI